MAKRSILLFAVCFLMFTLAQGCASGRKYAWGKYDTDLYYHYKKPQDREGHMERLKEIVDNAEADNRVPPGLYAEYGYCLYETGNIDEAVIYFEREKGKWPESNVLMEKMVRNARRQQESLKRSSSTTPSPGPEGEK